MSRRLRPLAATTRWSWCTAAPIYSWQSFPFLGPELAYSDPPYLRATRRSSQRYRFEYEEADHVALLELLNPSWHFFRLAGSDLVSFSRPTYYMLCLMEAKPQYI